MTFHKYCNIAKQIKRALHLTELCVWPTVARYATILYHVLCRPQWFFCSEVQHTENHCHRKFKGNDKIVPVHDMMVYGGAVV
jgi:hypothetical protein